MYKTGGLSNRVPTRTGKVRKFRTDWKSPGKSHKLMVLVARFSEQLHCQDNCLFPSNYVNTSEITNYFYRPQTKFAKVMFLHLSVSHSVHGGSTWAGTPPGRYTPRAGTTPPVQVHTPWAGTPPPPGQVPPPSSACWEIRATSGRYASHWNAFLFQNNSQKVLGSFRMKQGMFSMNLFLIFFP